MALVLLCNYILCHVTVKLYSLKRWRCIPHPLTLFWPRDLLWPIEWGWGDGMPLPSLGPKRPYIFLFCLLVPQSLPEDNAQTLLSVPEGEWETCGAEPPNKFKPQSADLQLIHKCLSEIYAYCDVSLMFGGCLLYNIIVAIGNWYTIQLNVFHFKYGETEAQRNLGLQIG